MARSRAAVVSRQCIVKLENVLSRFLARVMVMYFVVKEK